MKNINYSEDFLELKNKLYAEFKEKNETQLAIVIITTIIFLTLSLPFLKENISIIIGLIFVSVFIGVFIEHKYSKWKNKKTNQNNLFLLSYLKNQKIIILYIEELEKKLNSIVKQNSSKNECHGITVKGKITNTTYSPLKGLEETSKIKKYFLNIFISNNLNDINNILLFKNLKRLTQLHYFIDDIQGITDKLNQKHVDYVNKLKSTDNDITEEKITF